MAITLSADQIAAALGGEVRARGEEGHPLHAVIDSRETGSGDLFFGLRGASVDGGAHAADALAAGAWGAVVGPAHAQELEGGWVFEVENPLAALGSLARAWRRALGAKVIGVTGSVGKTSVKDIARALIPGAVHASPENFNTEIGLPLTVLSAPEETDVLVLEMAMRGVGQIRELAEIAEPDVAVITNVGPVHVELLGSVEAIAAVKAEILAGLPAHGAAVVPVDAGLLDSHLRDVPQLITFGDDGDVRVASATRRGQATEALIVTPAGEQLFAFGFSEAHNLTNALAAIGAGVALGVEPAELAARASEIGFSRLRGEHLVLGDRVNLVNDSYNANPVSMRAALDHLASLEAESRIAVLGEMAELGEGAAGFHAEVGRHARTLGIDSVIGVGEAARDYEPDELVGTPEEAAELLAGRVEPGDAVLVKGSRSAAMEGVAEALREILDEGGA